VDFVKEIKIDASPNQLWVTPEARAAENAHLRKQLEDENHRSAQTVAKEIKR